MSQHEISMHILCNAFLIHASSPSNRLSNSLQQIPLCKVVDEEVSPIVLFSWQWKQNLILTSPCDSKQSTRRKIFRKGYNTQQGCVSNDESWKMNDDTLVATYLSPYIRLIVVWKHCSDELFTAVVDCDCEKLKNCAIVENNLNFFLYVQFQIPRRLS